MQGVTVVDHPLVQHKLTIMRNKETSTAGFRRLLREISLLLGYEVTRNLELTTTTIETPMRDDGSADAGGQEAGLRLGAARRQRPARRPARPGAGGARRPYRPLPRPRDAGGGRIFLQGAERPRRPAGDRRRSDAGDRQFGDRGDRQAEGPRRHQSALPLPAGGARRHRALHQGASRRAGLHRLDRPASSTRRATSCPASATPATACTGRNRPAISRISFTEFGVYAHSIALQPLPR